MKFSTREDVEAPVDYVFGQISDFGAFERQALRRGADVRRLDSGPFVTGSAWDAHPHCDFNRHRGQNAGSPSDVAIAETG